MYADFARGLIGWNRVTGVKSWLELVQTTSIVILLISAEFQGDFPGSKRVISVKPWVVLVQISPKVILNIFSGFKEISGELSEFLW